MSQATAYKPTHGGYPTTKRLATHGERVAARQRVNNKPYSDNPKGWAYNSFGDLVHPETKMPHEFNKETQQYEPC